MKHDIIRNNTLPKSSFFILMLVTVVLALETGKSVLQIFGSLISVATSAAPHY